MSEVWKSLVEINEKNLGRLYKASDGLFWIFAGLLHADDDYYYLFTMKDRFKLVTCVASFEQSGMELVPHEIPQN